uniref:MAR-binding protein n=1 Tax=Solanum tuberosum TaxID=4113 RepID=M1B0D4_SOLTU
MSRKERKMSRAKVGNIPLLAWKIDELAVFPRKSKEALHIHRCRRRNKQQVAAADRVVVLKQKSFSKFEVENTSEALSVAMLLINSKPNKGLRKFLKAHCDGETLVVADSKLGNAIKEKLVYLYDWWLIKADIGDGSKRLGVGGFTAKE